MFFLPSTKYKKQFRTLPKRKQIKALERLEVFKLNPFECILNNHSLNGEYEGCRSINVTGDIRIVYEAIENSNCILHEIGTHSQLYE